MKLPEQDGFYKYYDGCENKKTIVLFQDMEIYLFGNDYGLEIEEEDDEGSYFIEPIEPITFD